MPRLLLLALAAFTLAACRADEGAGLLGGRLQPGRQAASEEGEVAVLLGERTLVLGTPTGDVTVRATDSAEARVRYVREARGATRTSAAERLARVRVDRAENGYLVQVIADTDGLEGASVRLEAEIPRGAALVVQARHGDVAVSGVEGDLLVEVERGEIEASGLAGRQVWLTARRGAIRAGFAVLSENADLRALTQSGDVEVTLPPGASVVVTAGTTTGALRTEGLPFEEERTEGRDGRRRFQGQLGGGRARLRAETDAGDVTLRAGGR